MCHRCKSDFGIIFATFSRTGTAAGMADVAFEMLDTSHDGKLQFSAFIKFIAGKQSKYPREYERKVEINIHLVFLRNSSYYPDRIL